jgi:hypothetical protein
MLQHILRDQEIRWREFFRISGIQVKRNVWSGIFTGVLLNDRANNIVTAILNASPVDTP